MNILLNKIPIIKTVVLIGIILNAGFSFSQKKVYVYNLETFENAVHENNLQLKISENNSKIVTLSIKEAISALLPQVNGQVNAKRYFNDQYTYFEAPDYENIDPITGEIPMSMQQYKMGFDNEFQSHLLLQQNLFSLKSIYDLKSAQQYSDIGKLQNEDKVIAIIAEAKKAFLQTILMQKVHDVNKISEKFAEVNYLDAKNKYENKLIAELELLQAKIRWEEEVPKLLKAKRNYLILLGNLKVIAGINPTDSIILNYDLSVYKYNNPISNISNAIDQRVDYQLLEANNILQELNIKNKQSAYYPTLDLEAGYSYFSSSDNWTVTENQNKYLYAGVTLTIPIFSSGYRKSQLSKAKILSDNALLEKQEARLSMTVEIQNLEMKLTEEYKIIQVAKSISETAKKAYNIAVETTKSGLISQLDLRKISTDYKMAEINMYHSIYNFKCTQIEYNNAIANY